MHAWERGDSKNNSLKRLISTLEGKQRIAKHEKDKERKTTTPKEKT